MHIVRSTELLILQLHPYMILLRLSAQPQQSP